MRAMAVFPSVVSAPLGVRPALARDRGPRPPTSPAPTEPAAPAPAEPTPPPAAPPTRQLTPSNPSYTAGETTSGPIRDTEEKKDSGLGLEWVWIDAGGGFAYANMASFDSNNFALQNTAGSGGTFSVGAGVRLISFTAGLRGRGLLLSTGNLVEIDGEVGLHTRIDHFETYFGVRGGYAFSGTLSSDTVSSAAAGGGTPRHGDGHRGKAGGLLGFERCSPPYSSTALALKPATFVL